MCERRDSINAVRDAAMALTVACTKVCPDQIGQVLKSIYDDTLREAVPDDFLDLIGKIQ